MPDEKLVEKLKKIKAHADSAKDIGNEEEAQAFASMLQRLLAKHNLDMSSVEWDQQKQEKASTLNWKASNKKKAATSSWVYLLASIIAEANNCRVIIHHYSNMVQFVGTDSAIRVCEQTMDYMYQCAIRFARHAEAQEKKNLGYNLMWAQMMKGFKNSYRLGFIIRLEERFKEEAAKIKKEYTGSTSLIRLSESLRLADAYLATMDLKNYSARGSEVNSYGYTKGRKKADELNIGGDTIPANTSKKGLLR
jgi:Protein of unknown function (DUF2786)